MNCTQHNQPTQDAETRAVWYVAATDAQAMVAKAILTECTDFWGTTAAPIILVEETAHTRLIRRLRERMASLNPVSGAVFSHSWLDGGATLIQGGLESGEGFSPALFVIPLADSLWLRAGAPRAAALLVLRVSDRFHAESLLSSLGALIFQTPRWG